MLLTTIRCGSQRLEMATWNSPSGFDPLDQSLWGRKLPILVPAKSHGGDFFPIPIPERGFIPVGIPAPGSLNKTSIHTRLLDLNAQGTRHPAHSAQGQNLRIRRISASMHDCSASTRCSPSERLRPPLVLHLRGCTTAPVAGAPPSRGCCCSVAPSQRRRGGR
jgi:hypothetical protein